MSGDKKYYIADQQVGPGVSVQLGSTAGAMTLGLGLGLDMGTAPKVTHDDLAAVLDGRIRRGATWDARNFFWPLQGELNVSTIGGQAKIERFKDAALDWFDALMDPQGDLIEFKQERKDANDADVARIIDAEATELASYKIDQKGRGHFRNNPVIRYPVPASAPWPWWRDEDVSTNTIMGFGTGGASVPVINLGPMPCGLKFSVVGQSSVTGVTITNQTTGRQVSWSGSALHATTPHVIDFYVDDPRVFATDFGGSSLIPVLGSPYKTILLAKTFSTIHVAVTEGTGTGDLTITRRHWWPSP